MARTSQTTSKERLNKSQIAKIAQDSARKTVRKETNKIAREAGRVASKVATEVSLNPDYELNDEEELEGTPLMAWANGDEFEEDEDEDEDVPSSVFGLGRSFKANHHDDEEEEDEGTADLSKDIINRDIFSYANDLMNKGTPIRIQVKKNGQFLTTIKKPYSEEQLQKDHGEGHYLVILRNDIKGTFIKQQSFSVAAPPLAPHETAQVQQVKQEEKIDKMFQTFSQMQSAQTESQNQLFERLLEEQRRREDEEKERRYEEREQMKSQEAGNTNLLATVLQAALTGKKDDGGGMSSVLQMMQQQQNQTTQMIMESNKNFMMMIQEMRKDSQMMMEKVAMMNQEQARDFRTQLAEMSKGTKSDGFDPVQMFKMLNDTREAGMNFGLKINDLAKQIADSDIAPAQPKSIVESVLDNLGKFAPLMLAASQNSNAQAHFAPPAPRPALQAAPQQPSYKQPTAPRQAAPKQPTQQAVVTPKVAPTTIQTGPKAVKTVNTTATKVAGTPIKTQAKPTTTKTSVASGTEGGKIGTDTGLKTKVIDLCVPLIAHALQNGISSGDLGEATTKSFYAQGVTLKEALSTLSVDDINNLAFVTYGLPDMPEIRHYLKDYHDYLSQKASVEQHGQTA